MFHSRYHLALGGSVTLEPIGDEHPWHILQAFEELFEELLGRLLVPSQMDSLI